MCVCVCACNLRWYCKQNSLIFLMKMSSKKSYYVRVSTKWLVLPPGLLSKNTKHSSILLHHRTLLRYVWSIPAMHRTPMSLATSISDHQLYYWLSTVVASYIYEWCGKSLNKKLLQHMRPYFLALISSSRYIFWSLPCGFPSCLNSKT